MTTVLHNNFCQLQCYDNSKLTWVYPWRQFPAITQLSLLFHNFIHSKTDPMLKLLKVLMAMSSLPVCDSTVHHRCVIHLVITKLFLKKATKCCVS